VEVVGDEDPVDEIDEGIPHVALVLEVYGQVQEVVLVLLLLVESLEQHFSSVFIRDVLDHNGGPLVFTADHFSEVNTEISLILVLPCTVREILSQDPGSNSRRSAATARPSSLASVFLVLRVTP